MIENPATATPVEIDTELAKLDAHYFRLTGRYAATIERAHSNDGQRKVYRTRKGEWPISDADTVASLRAKADTELPEYKLIPILQILTDLENIPEAIKTNRAEFERLDAEYEARRWSRFIVVEHVHSGYWCAGGSVRATSVRQWLPEYSGMNEAEAIAELGASAHMLCTHCFPNAPVVKAAPQEGVCTNKSYDPAKPKRSGYAYGNFATCAVCGTRASLTSTGNLRKHKIEN